HDARSRLPNEEFTSHRVSLAGRQLALLGDDLATARRAAHSAAGAQAKPCSPRNVVDGMGHLTADNVAYLGFEDRFAGAGGVALTRPPRNALDDPPSASAVAVHQAPCCDGCEGVLFGEQQCVRAT